MKFVFRFEKWAYMLSVVGAAVIVALTGSVARNDGGWSAKALAYMVFAILPYGLHGWLAKTFCERVLSAIIFIGTMLSVFFGSSLYLDALILTKNVAPWPMFIEIPMAQFKFLAGLTVVVAVGRLIGLAISNNKNVHSEVEKKWTRENVLKHAADVFPEEDLKKVMSILDLYGRKETEKTRARVQLAILRLCRGNLDRLFETAMDALDDDRRILRAADHADVETCTSSVEAIP